MSCNKRGKSYKQGNCRNWICDINYPGPWAVTSEEQVTSKETVEIGFVTTHKETVMAVTSEEKVASKKTVEIGFVTLIIQAHGQ